MLIKNFFVFLVFTFISLSFYPQLNIKIRIFSQYDLKSVVITPINGEYFLVAKKDTIKKLNNLEVINIFTNGASIIVQQWLTFLGAYDTILLLPKSNNSYLRIKSIDPELKVRYYDGVLFFKLDSILHNIVLINEIDLEEYIAGVVESEIGADNNLPIEYLKTQAVISRTYSLKNLGIYSDYGYDLCDNINCQAYYGKALKNINIRKAVKVTEGLVIVDSSMNLINSFFHSNSGGETAYTYQVWNDTLDYIISVVDSFSMEGKNYKWDFKIKKSIWIEYLKQKGILLPDNYDFTYKMKHRTKFLEFSNGLAIKVTDIRKDWGLKSAFFDIYDDGTTLFFSGRGYGHGVGLSQEGAENMAKKGFNFREILFYYYNNIKIVPYNEIMKEKPSKE